MVNFAPSCGCFHDHSFSRLLATYGISALDINDPLKAKQTSTTQRFKLGLVTPSGERLPTKIEFSRRGSKGQKGFDRVDPEIARHYNRLAFRCYHLQTCNRN